MSVNPLGALSRDSCTCILRSIGVPQARDGRSKPTRISDQESIVKGTKATRVPVRPLGVDEVLFLANEPFISMTMLAIRHPGMRAGSIARQLYSGQLYSGSRAGGSSVARLKPGRYCWDAGLAIDPEQADRCRTSNIALSLVISDDAVAVECTQVEGAYAHVALDKRASIWANLRPVGRYDKKVGPC